MQKYNKENFKELLKTANWKSYKKKVVTQAVEILGEFKVETSEGTMTCRDGYLAVDSRGYPYPIAKDEFESIYDEVKK